MKKLFTLTLIAIVALSFSVVAQRHVDIAVTSVTLQGSTFSTGNNFPFKCTFKNNGPDSLRATDSVEIIVGAQGDTVWAYLGLVPIAVASGASINVSDTDVTSPAIVKHTWHGFKADSTKTFCVEVIPYNRSASGLVDTSTANNTLCSPTMKLLDVNNLTASGNASVSMYPNPVHSQGFFDVRLLQSGNVTITIFDLTGRVVINENMGKYGSGNQIIQLNTSNLSNGMYIYQVNIDGDTKNGKFYISK